MSVSTDISKAVDSSFATSQFVESKHWTINSTGT